MGRRRAPSHAWSTVPILDHLVSRGRGATAARHSRVRQRRCSLLVVAALVAVGVPFVVVRAAGADETISSDGGPLTNITISNDLNCSVHHVGDTEGEWFGDTACGTFVAVGGTLYGPASVPAGPESGDPGYEAYPVPTNADGAPDNQSISGTGSAGNPFTVTTRVVLGESNLVLTEVDTYVVGTESYTTRVSLTNPTTNAVDPIVYRGGDCYLQDSDSGLGDLQNGDAPVCKALSSSANPDRIEAMYPITEGSHYLEGYYGCVWDAIESQTQLPDTIDYVDGGEDDGAVPERATPAPAQPTDDPGDGCSHQDTGPDGYDNGLGLSWGAPVDAGATTSISALTVFSPLGSAPLSFSKTADESTTQTGGSDGYTITVSNPGSLPETLTSITDTLPAGFSYAAGSSSGATSDDPTTAGRAVTWSGRFVVPSADDDGPGSTTLHFRVTASTAPGTYTNSVTGTGPGITVIPATDVAPVTVAAAPTAVDDSYTTPEDTELNVGPPGVLANDTNPSGGTLEVAPETATAPSHGTVTVNGNGSFSYTPAAGYHGPDSFTYEATNGAEISAPATVHVTVTQVEHAPVAHADAYSTNEDTTLTTPAPGVLGNDTDADGDPLTAVLDTQPAHGTVTLDADGRFVYVPVANYNGPDSFTYHASDGTLDSAPATVSITVHPVLDPIIARNDEYTVAQDTTLTVGPPGVLGNDSDPDGRARAVALSQPEHGTLTLSTDGSFGYVPAAGFHGTDSFVYTAGDDSQATVTIDVSAVDHAPVANDDSYSGPEDTAITAATRATGVLGNDTDPDGDTLTASVVGGVSHGTLTFQPDGTFSYLPDADYVGTDTFTYRDSDGTLTSALATVTLTITPVDDRPVAEPDVYSTPEDTTLTVSAPGVLGNDTEPDGDATLAAEKVTNPSHGTVTLDADGSLRYVPNTRFVGTDTFTYAARDGELLSDPVTVTIHVTQVDHPPAAHPDSYTTPRNTTLTVAAPGVLTNDSDPDGNALSAQLVSGPAHGTLTLLADGRFVYTPAHGFTGTDTFRYRADDGLSTSPSVQVTITVTAPVTPPPTSTPPTSTPPTSTPPSTSAPTSSAPTTPSSTVPTTPSSTVPSTTGPTTGSTPTSPTTSANPPSGNATPTAPSAPRTNPPATSGSHRTLKLTAPSIIPGGALRAAGSGCAANSPVQLTVAGRSAGTGTADAQGRFDVPVSTDGLGVGAYTITARCGDRQLIAPVSLVYVTSDSNAPTAQALVVAAALAFFLLLLGLVVRRPTS